MKFLITMFDLKQEENIEYIGSSLAERQRVEHTCDFETFENLSVGLGEACLSALLSLGDNKVSP